MKKPVTTPHSLEILVVAWNQCAEDLMQRHGVVRGTRKFLDALVKDELLGSRSVLVSSFGADSSVPMEMLTRNNPDFPVVLIDPGHLFTETFVYREMLQERLGLTNAKIYTATVEQFDSYNPFADSPTCCDDVKKALTDEAVAGYLLWITGRKRIHGHERKKLPLVELDYNEIDGKIVAHIKVNPMALWKQSQITDYMKRHKLPAHPLKKKGYHSIGCRSCTVRGKDREGRWPGQGDKTECGMHNRKLRPKLRDSFDPQI